MARRCAAVVRFLSRNKGKVGGMGIPRSVKWCGAARGIVQREYNEGGVSSRDTALTITVYRNSVYCVRLFMQVGTSDFLLIRRHMTNLFLLIRGSLRSVICADW